MAEAGNNEQYKYRYEMLLFTRRVPPELMPNAQYFVCRDCVARAFPHLDTGHRDRRQTDFRNMSTASMGEDIDSTLYDPYASERLEVILRVFMNSNIDSLLGTTKDRWRCSSVSGSSQSYGTGQITNFRD